MYCPESIKNSEQVKIETTHTFSDNEYAKGMSLPAGHVALSHKHNYSHLSCLAKGKCLVYQDGEKQELEAPAMIVIKAGVEHQIEALEDSFWYCIHATDIKDPEKIDKVVIADGTV